MHRNRGEIEQHCRQIIEDCLNYVEDKGDTYVSIHKDDEDECVVLTSLLRSERILSVVVADRILFSETLAPALYRAVNEMNSESITGWHTIIQRSGIGMYAYRRAVWMSEELSHEQFVNILWDCIGEYKSGRAQIAAISDGEIQ